MTARQVKRIQNASGLIFNPFPVKMKGSSVMKHTRITVWALPLIIALALDLSQSGCGSVPKDPPPSPIKTAQTPSETDEPGGEEAIPLPDNAQTSEPLIIWGDDGVPLLNENALAENTAQKEKEQEEPQADHKKQKRKKKTDEPEKISGLTGTDNKNISFVVRTNLPIAKASTKTRMQELYEFTSRVNKKRNLPAIPDMAVTNTQENLPLFSEEELTAINDLNGSVRLMTSFETKIRLVNDNLRFIVLDYSYEPMPPLETRLTVYRNGERIGMVKVTGPVMNGSTVAIIVEGEPQVGDTVLRETW